MLWENFLVNRFLHDDEIIRGTASLFHANDQQIFVTSDITLMEHDTRSLSWAVLVERGEARGDVKQRLDIYLLGKPLPLTWMKPTARSHAALLVDFCRLLNCTCLVPGETLSITDWFHVDEKGFQRVTLDSEEIDDDVYRVIVPKTTHKTKRELSSAGAR